MSAVEKDVIKLLFSYEEISLGSFSVEIKQWRTRLFGMYLIPFLLLQRAMLFYELYPHKTLLTPVFVCLSPSGRKTPAEENVFLRPWYRPQDRTKALEKIRSEIVRVRTFMYVVGRNEAFFVFSVSKIAMI